MTHQRAKAALDGTRFADLRWVPETGSTQTDLIEAAGNGDAECALVADLQSAGRGRLDRTFVAPPGASLMMSVLVRPPFPPAGPQMVTVALGVAAVDAIAALCDVPVGLKWPNDLVAIGSRVDGADLKLGGILAQLVDGVNGTAVVAGLGVNVAWAPTGFPADLVDTATSLDLLGAPVRREDLAVEILRNLGEFDLSAPDATAQLMERYRSRCTTLGRSVRVELPGGRELIGTATDVDDRGAIVVLDDVGDRHCVDVGDIVHLRRLD